MTTVKPKVFKNHGKQRLGRGFSREELKKAGSNLQEALRFGLPVDAKRKTAHEENVAVAKTFLQKKKTESKQKKLASKQKKLESEEKKKASKEKKPASKPKKPRGKPKS